MTDYDEPDEERIAQADAHGHASREPEPDPDDADDRVLGRIGVDPEALASWNLKRIRVRLGVSQQEISDRLALGGSGVRLAQTQIAKIERGERPWRVNEMFAIAEALRIRQSELLTEQGLDDAPQMALLAARVAYQEAKAEEANSWEHWRRSVSVTRAAGVHMCRTAAKYGIEDDEVMDFLASSFIHLSWLQAFEAAEPKWSSEEKQEAARTYALRQWQRFVSEPDDEPPQE
ncbi:helix-turn-helix domain-containing protein [Streptomyces galilaeus]